MTKAEFLKKKTDADEVAIFRTAHALHVKKAVFAGIKVSGKVLADYMNNFWAQKALAE